jgi:hypothetical protein
MLLDLHRRLDERGAQLAAVCAEHGLEPPNGVMTLRRIRALENVRDLVFVYQRTRDEADLRALVEAAGEAGRQP